MRHWLEALPDAAQQRALDAWAIDDLGIPGLELMERAGAGLARVCLERAPAGTVAVVCGAGNNGGDGLVAARLMKEQGREVNVLMLADPGALRGDALANYERLAPGVSPVPFSERALSGATLIVDAILGTGFAGTPREPAGAAIAAINRSGAEVVACDVPSGVDASTGEISGEAVRAAATVTFHAAKPGLWIAPGKGHAGAVTIVDIGIPAGDGAPAAPQAGLIESSLLAAVPRRGAESNKFTAGSVLVCGGSRGLTGAPALAALAAARAGAGYVTVAAAATLVDVLATKLLEVMQVALPDEDGALTPEAVAAVLERSRRVQSLVLGPGLGRAPTTQAFVRELARQAALPLVLDADGLSATTGAELDALSERPGATILTPHAGELARLLETGSDEVSAHRLAHVREAARRSRAIVVLKGDDTLIADPGGFVAVSRGGAPALATAGTGDVLAGTIGALLAKRMDPFEAACAGVWIHVEAGRLAARSIGGDGVIASDVVAQLPRALAGVGE
jgi:ADP-dependent NAD(P)H-hydrate dehydratase / NAD(P)H-hydrate epimerase